MQFATTLVLILVGAFGIGAAAATTYYLLTTVMEVKDIMEGEEERATRIHTQTSHNTASIAKIESYLRNTRRFLPANGAEVTMTPLQPSEQDNSNANVG